MKEIIGCSWKRLLRNKANTFWILLFPIVLGTLFKIGFSNMANSENMKAIPVAVVCEADAYGDALTESLTAMEEDEDAFLDATFCDEEEALKLLEKKEVVGIIYSGERIELTISANMGDEPTNQSILNTFVNRYNIYQDAIVKIMEEHPENIADVLKKMDVQTNYIGEKSLSTTPDNSPFTQYFYNLLAMACLFTAFGGVQIATDNQANISDLAVRKTIAPTHKLKVIVGDLIATSLFQFVLNMVGFMYVAIVLKIDLTTRLPLQILTMFIGCLVGVSLGLFIGSIGKKKKDFKQGMVFAISMPLCFFSGLMMGQMKIIIENSIPFFNRINPAALITDSFYCLCTFDGFERFTTNCLTLLGYVVIFCIIGFLVTRRQRYASL